MKQLSVFDVARESWELTLKHKAMLLWMMFLYMAISIPGSFLIDPDFGMVNTDPGVAVLGYLLSLALSICVMWIMMINMCHMAAGKESLGWSVWRDYPGRNYLRMVGVGLVWMLVAFAAILVVGGMFMYMFFSQLGGGASAGGGITLVLAGLGIYVGMIYLMLRYLFSAWIALFEGKKVFESFTLGALMTQGVKWKLIGGYLLTILVMIGVMIGCAIALFIPAMFLESFTIPSVIVLVAVAVAAIAAYLMVMIWMMIGMFVAYIKLKAQTPELQGQSAPAASQKPSEEIDDEDEVIEVEEVEEEDAR